MLSGTFIVLSLLQARVSDQLSHVFDIITETTSTLLPTFPKGPVSNPLIGRSSFTVVMLGLEHVISSAQFEDP